MPTEDKFAEWYALPVPNFTREQLTSRLKAVGVITKDFPVKEIAGLVRMFYSMPTSELFSESVRKRIREQDERYTSRDTAELAIIAGAVIFDLALSASHTGDAAALAVTCFEAAGLRNAKRLQDVVDRCQQYLLEESVRVREEAPKVPDFPTQTLSTSISKLKEKHGDLAQYATAVDDLLLKMTRAIGDYTKVSAEQIDYFERRRQEESNILYWMFSKAGRDGKIEYAKLSTKEAAILAAFDLSHLTKDLPGPSRARGFLHYIIQSAQGDPTTRVTIPDCVNAIDEARRPSLAAQYTSGDPCLTPTLYAINKCHESGAGNDWTGAFKTQTQLDPRKKLNIVDVSELLYSELLVTSSFL